MVFTFSSTVLSVVCTESIESARHVVMKIAADQAVSFCRKDAGPRAPKAACVEAPPNALAISVLPPDCNSTINIRMILTRTCKMVTRVIII